MNAAVTQKTDHEKFDRSPLPALDLLRSFATLQVVFYHLCIASWRVPESETYKLASLDTTLMPLLDAGWHGFVGVEIFFVISGYIIMRSAEGVTSAGFLRGRIIRLFPSAWICATFSLATMLIARADIAPATLLQQYLHSMTLFPLAPWIDGVYWTIGIEIAFYTIVFFVLVLGRGKEIVKLTTAIGLISGIYWLAAFHFFKIFALTNIWNRGLELSMISYGVYFALGALIYDSSHNKLKKSNLLIIGVLLIAALIEIDFKTWHNNIILQISRSSFAPSAIFLVAMLVVCVSASWRSTPGIVKILRDVGLTTYPLYLLHNQIGAAMIHLFSKGGVSIYWALALSIAFSMILALAVNILLEPRVKRLLLPFVNRLKQTPA